MTAHGDFLYEEGGLVDMLRCTIVVALVVLLSVPALAQFAPFPPAGGATQPQGGAVAPPATGGFPAPAGGFAPPQGAPVPGGMAPGMGDAEDMQAYAMMEMVGMCQPAIAVENNMIYIASGGMLTIYRLDGNTLTKIAEGPYAVAAPMPGMGGM